MNNSNSYYQRNSEKLLKQAKNRYHHEDDKEQSKHRYHDKVVREESKDNVIIKNLFCIIKKMSKAIFNLLILR